MIERVGGNNLGIAPRHRYVAPQLCSKEDDLNWTCRSLVRQLHGGIAASEAKGTLRQSTLVEKLLERTESAF